MTTHPILLRANWLLVGRRASGFVQVAKRGVIEATPQYEVLNVAPAFSFGIPTAWVSTFDEDYYNGAAQDVDGHAIGVEYHAGDFTGLAPRHDDPPTFEAQASHLLRHNLLTDAERRPLSDADFAPERIAIPADDEPDCRAVHSHVWDRRCFDERRH